MYLLTCFWPNIRADQILTADASPYHILLVIKPLKQHDKLLSLAQLLLRDL
jgi:hypothetical protein